MPLRVIGPRSVAGVEPGGVIDDDTAAALNIEALLAAGHVAEAKPAPKPPKTDTVDEKED